MDPVERAIMATPDKLASYISHIIIANPMSFNLKVSLATELPRSDKQAIWDMFSANMSHFYRNSSSGWHPPSKKRELFHRLARYILVRQGAEDDGPIVAYVTFRFEREDDCNVVYCYEIQIMEEFQRCGLGKKLMQSLLNIGRYRKLEKIMLTVFKANNAAVEFYKNFGFSIDPTSPGYISPSGEPGDEEEEYDYEIMSISIPSSH